MANVIKRSVKIRTDEKDYYFAVEMRHMLGRDGTHRHFAARVYYEGSEIYSFISPWLTSGEVAIHAESILFHFVAFAEHYGAFPVHRTRVAHNGRYYWVMTRYTDDGDAFAYMVFEEGDRNPFVFGMGSGDALEGGFAAVVEKVAGEKVEAASLESRVARVVKRLKSRRAHAAACASTVAEELEELRAVAEAHPVAAYPERIEMLEKILAGWAHEAETIDEAIGELEG